jgi:ABC-type polysaccharide/polyol phosphate export permease
VLDAPNAARRRVEDRTVRVVSARPGLGRRLAAIWNARELLIYFVITDIKIKYKSSALGLLWSLVAPALTLGIYYLVFAVLLRNYIPDFVVYLFAGLMVWNFFSNIVTTSTGIVVDRAAVVKKVAFPREILALSTVGTSFVFFAMQSIILVIFMVITGHSPDWQMLWLLPLTVIGLSLVAGSIGILLSAVNVYLRDTKHLIDVFMQLWFYLTPIVYSFEKQVSPQLHKHGIVWIYFLNPVSTFVLTFQRVLYRQTVVHSTQPGHHSDIIKALPTWPTTTYFGLNMALIVFGAIAFIGAVSIFGRLEGNFAEAL